MTRKQKVQAVLRDWKSNKLNWADALAQLCWLGYDPETAARTLARE